MVVYPRHDLKVGDWGGGVEIFPSMKKFLDSTDKVEVHHIIGVGEDQYYLFKNSPFWYHKSFFKNSVRLV